MKYLFFEHYHKTRIDSVNKNLDWKKIKQIHQRLKEWYDDVENYHLIGFIINARFMTLEDIIIKTENKTKLETKDFFIQTIKDNFAQEKTKDNQTYKVYAIDKLRYDSSYAECKNILLLYNNRSMMHNLQFHI